MKQVAVTALKTYIQSATALDNLTDALTENNSIWLGNDPESSTSTAEKNVGVGVDALDAITVGDENTAVGYDALTKLTEGHKNVAVGVGALSELTEGHGNMAVGYNALNKVDEGTGNVALGRQSLTGVTSGSKNVAIGRQSGRDVDDSEVSGGADLTTGHKNTYIGAHTQPSANAVENETVIGYGATGKGGNNKVVIGNAAVTDFYASEDGEATLHVGSINLENDETISNADDGTLAITAPNTTVSGNLSGSGSLSGFDATLVTPTNDYTLSASDNGKVIAMNKSTAVTVTIPDDLGEGFNCLIVQKHDGQVTIQAAGGSSVDIINRSNHTKTHSKYAVVSLVNIGGEVYILSGDTGT
tara:strand:- start:1221 stop:2294 length:1074 start_codon:yes stop_codon:yes gene_type:complete